MRNYNNLFDEKNTADNYGIVWDAEQIPEQVVLDCENKIPVLLEIGEKEVKTGSGEDHILIEGDNYHALKVLNETHRENIGVIYIDPPYNTGKAKEWKYNDKYVNPDDTYRHSKWLNFMAKRLQLAKNLLTDDGVIFISIDDNELYQLKLLCDKIFGEENFIANFVRIAKSGGGHDSVHVAIEYDYVLAFAKNREKVVFNKQLADVNDSKYRYSDDFVEKRGKYYLRDLDYRGSYSRSLDYEITAPDGTKMYSGNKFGEPNTWRWGKEKFQWGVENDFIVFKKSKSGWKVYIKQYQFVDNKDQPRVRKLPYRALIDYKNTRGAKRLKEILDQKVFQYPKPVELIEFLINLVYKDGIIVLDFFAGTGTTGDAVLQMNHHQNKSAKFILCTNNENDICTEVTYPRLKRIISGYTKVGNGTFIEGTSGNLRYFVTGFGD